MRCSIGATIEEKRSNPIIIGLLSVSEKPNALNIPFFLKKKIPKNPPTKK
jgi:hypothetical protein